MIRFQCDYAEGAHPAVLEALMRTNMEQTPGYGEDEYCGRAAGMIQELCGRQDADVHFLVGGTQANLTVIAAALRPHQAAVCAQTGHIHVHESGAVEATGHKCIPLPGPDGKLTAKAVDDCLKAHFDDENHEHMAQPGMVYISISTELGANYTRAELETLYAACVKWKLPLYIDGARIACAMADKSCDWDLSFLCRHCDAFTLGGTKAGLFFGEALVITLPALKKDFRYIMKQRGGMLAKGRLLGVQYAAMLETGLYFQLARHAVAEADRIRETLDELGVPQLTRNGTNQIFPILPDSVTCRLEEKYALGLWERTDENHTVQRLVTSWATKPENVDALLADLRLAWKELV